MAGCDQHNSNYLRGPFFTNQNVSVAWHSEGVLDGACSSSPDAGGLLVCTASLGDQERRTVLGYSRNGTCLWRNNLVSSNDFPLIGISDIVLHSDDGSLLSGYTLTGGLVGSPIRIYPALGVGPSIAFTANGVFLMASKLSGDVAAYLTDGIPHASIWLNGTPFVCGSGWVVIVRRSPLACGSR
jgi:hypothetical protein